MYNKMDNLVKVLKILFENPTEKFHIRELARKTKLNPNTIINITNKLEKQNTIKKHKNKFLVEVFLNLENPSVLFKKKLFNLQSISESNIIPFLTKKFNPEFISVMGSYSRGEDIESSDIDIVLKSSKEEFPDLNKFEKKLKRKIQLLFLPKKVSEEFFNNLINGIVLYGVLRR